MIQPFAEFIINSEAEFREGLEKLGLRSNIDEPIHPEDEHFNGYDDGFLLYNSDDAIVGWLAWDETDEDGNRGVLQIFRDPSHAIRYLKQVSQ